ncbi:MAG: bifunctional ornithine acetyltransferase/N-acetylglutamate synthase, partial [Phenylobacterium sp.]|nr:bifunctional ornithine acetyltransferase/N-acetylglutamate synthase [Phenylobacterium sp.]
MSRKPKPAAAPRRAAKAAPKPVEVVGQTLERAFDPLASAIKRAALRRADKLAHAFDTPKAADAPKAAKAAMPVSPLAVPFPKVKPIRGVVMATGRAGFYKHEREDLLVM